MAIFPVYMAQDKNEPNALHHSLTNTALLQNFSDNGVVMPSNSTTAITNLSTQMQDGTVWYDSDTGELKYRSSGVVKVLATV